MVGGRGELGGGCVADRRESEWGAWSGNQASEKGRGAGWGENGGPKKASLKPSSGSTWEGPLKEKKGSKIGMASELDFQGMRGERKIGPVGAK